MKVELIELLRCPCCQSSMEINSYIVDEIYYKSEEATYYEIRTGILICKQCKTRFEIRDYIPSFSQSGLVDNTIVKDGSYWGNYYSTLYDIGVMNFVDIKESFEPLYKYGLRKKLKWEERIYLNNNFHFTNVRPVQNDEFNLLINNRFVNDKPFNKFVVEIGCGSGWFCLELKRKGFNVIGLDPAFEALKLAKKYAISQGYYIEYIHSPLIPIFKNEIFNYIFAYHSLHHIPRLDKVAEMVKEWLKKGGFISLYEHSFSYSNQKFLVIISFVSRFVNLTIDILIQNLFSKELDSRLKTVHSGTSANEDISIYNINDFTRHFNIIHHNIYAHYFDDLPCLIWWVTKNRKITFNVIKLIDLIQKSLAVKYSNFKFYILETK